MHVSRFQQVSKKNFEKMDFWLKPLAQMIEKRLDPSLRLAGTFAIAAVCAYD
jgi:hypothetical protein